MNWTEILPVAVPAVVAVLAAVYTAWKARVVSDGVKDWQDGVVEAIDTLIAYKYDRAVEDETANEEEDEK